MNSGSNSPTKQIFRLQGRTPSPLPGRTGVHLPGRDANKVVGIPLKVLIALIATVIIFISFLVRGKACQCCRLLLYATVVKIH